MEDKSKETLLVSPDDYRNLKLNSLVVDVVNSLPTNMPERPRVVDWVLAGHAVRLAKVRLEALEDYVVQTINQSIPK